MWLDAVVTQDVCDQVILGCVGLLTHSTLPSLLVSANVHIVAVIYVNIETELLSAARTTSRSSFTGAMTGAEVLSGVETTRGVVHDRTRYEEGVWEKAVVERWEVGRVKKQRRGWPDGGRTEWLLFYLHRKIHIWRSVLKLQAVELDHARDGFWRWRGKRARWEGEGNVRQVHCLLTAAFFCLLCLLLRRFTSLVAIYF